jgi:cyanate permease
MVPIAAPAHTTASLGAIHNFGGYLGGALAPMTTGFVVQTSGSFVPAFLLAAGIAVACALTSFITVRHPITIADERIGPSAPTPAHSIPGVDDAADAE